MAQVILVINIKGGTGKSTISEHLSYKLRDEGHDVGVMDADIDSANLATRLGAKERVEFEGDHTIKPVEHDDLLLYSMENAFENTSFAQSGEFMKEVVNDMISHSNWGDIDYLVVDCPPGSSDVFEQLVRSLRPNMLGAVSVSQPGAVHDTVRLTKVCNHNWIPILGFIENMTGIVDEHGYITHNNSDKRVLPFGEPEMEEFCQKTGGAYLGSIPLCTDESLIPEHADEALSEAVSVIEEAEMPKLPEDHTQDPSFIKNLWKGLLTGVKNINSQFNVKELQDQYGVEDRDPLTIELELTDASGLTGIMSNMILKGGEGRMRVMRPKKAKRKGITPEGGIRISSQDLYNAINGKKTVMRSVTGEVTETSYSIIEAVQMGDAEVWGERTINRLSILDRVLAEAIPMDEVKKAVMEQ